MRAFDVKISIARFPSRRVIVMALSAADALLYIIESVPQACCITVRAQ